VVFPRLLPRLDSAHGVSNLSLCPSQVCSRRRVAYVHLCTSRAHVSVVVARASTPDLFSSGSLRPRSPRSVARVNSKGRDLRIEDARFDGLLGFDSRLGSVSATLRAPFDCGPREANVTDRSCLGLLPLSGLPGTFDVHRSRLEPRSIISLREAGACSFACAARRGILRARRDRVSLAIRSWALGDPSRDMTHRRAAVEEMCAAPPCAPA